VWWKYFLPAIPILIAGLAIVIFHVLARTTNLRNALSRLTKDYHLMTSVRGKSHMFVRLLNDNGDIEFQREYLLELVKDVHVETTKNELLISEVPMPQMPPKAEIISSTLSPQKLQSIKYSQTKENISGREHFHYSWYYQIDNPLVKKGDNIEYRYSCHIPKSESMAFTEEGGLLFVECGALYIELKVTLISPPGFEIEVVECKTIDYDGTERPLSENQYPVLDAVKAWVSGLHS